MSNASQPVPLPKRIEELEDRILQLEARLQAAQALESAAQVDHERLGETAGDSPTGESASLGGEEPSSSPAANLAPAPVQEGIPESESSSDRQGTSDAARPESVEASATRSDESQAKREALRAAVRELAKGGARPASSGEAPRGSPDAPVSAAFLPSSPLAAPRASGFVPLPVRPAPPSSGFIPFPARAAVASGGLGEAPPPAPPAAQAPRPRRSASSWELLLGGKWAAALGAIAVVFAVAYFVKYAYDEGFFRLLSNTTKCLLCAGFGITLLACGEIVLRKVNRWAATGLFSAGVAVLYLTAYASCKYFGLVSETGSLVLLSIVALIGVGITIRGNLLLVGVLSILGGFLNPILLGDRAAAPLAFPLYLTMVFGVALALSAYRPVPFRPLRYLGCCGIGILGALWAVTGEAPLALVLTFLGLWWGLTIIEALRAALRNESAIGNVVVSLIATTWMIVLGSYAINSMQTPGFDWTGVYMLAVSVVAAGIAMVFGSGLAGLRDLEESAISRFVVCLWMQAGALLAASIAVHFEGYGGPIGWLAIGVTAIELGRRLPSRGVSIYGLIVLCLAAARIFLIDSQANEALAKTIGTIGQITITHWSIVAAPAVIALHFAAIRINASSADARSLGVSLAVVGTIAWTILWLYHDTGVVVTIAWLIGAAGLALLARFQSQLHYDKQALALLALAFAKWFILDTLADRLDFGWIVNSSPALFTANVLCGLLFTGVCFAAGLVLRSDAERPSATQPAAGAPAISVSLPSLCFVLGLFAFGWTATFEVERLLMLSRLASESHVWSHGAAVIFALAIIWSITGLIGSRVGSILRDGPAALTGEALALGAAWLWLIAGSLAVRAAEGCASVTVLINFQAAAGLVAAITLLAMLLLRRADGEWSPLRTAPAHLLWITVGLIGLIVGSLEIDRWAVHNLADPAQARQVGWSIYWALYGIGLVIAGFAGKKPFVRYAGLVMLGFTLAKVFLIDTAAIDSTYRIASLLVVGLLLILTSIAYFKLIPNRIEATENA